MAAERFDRFADALEELGWTAQHLPSPADDRADVPALHPAAGQLDRGLDHRENEALDAVTEVLQIPQLHVVKTIVEHAFRLVTREQLSEALTPVGIQRLVVPECVVRIEP